MVTSVTVVGITWMLILDPGFWIIGLHRLDSISAAGDGLVAISLRVLDKPFWAADFGISIDTRQTERIGARRASHRIVIYRCI
jgi:hypothetical protein